MNHRKRTSARQSSPLRRRRSWVAARRRRVGARHGSRCSAQPPQRRAAAADDGLRRRRVPQAGTASTCHNQRAKIGGLALDTLDVSTRGHRRRDVGEGRQEDPHRHDAAERRAAAGAHARSTASPPSLETRLDKAADPNAALVTPALHRLNRTEYANAIRDLLALDVDVNALLPADGSSEGFDNIAEALARLAVADPGLRLRGDEDQPPGGRRSRRWRRRRSTYLAAGRAGAGPAHRGPAARHARRLAGSAHVPARRRVRVRVGGASRRWPGAGVDITLDGEQIKVDNPRSFRMKVTAGPHTIGARAASIGSAAPASTRSTRTSASTRRSRTPGGVQTLVDHRPVQRDRRRRHAEPARIFVCRPATAAEEATCARTILTTLARRAYRGPVSAAEVDTLMGFYQQGREGGDFESGIQQALARILVAPRFVFRVEEEPATIASGQAVSHQRFELASRLSFFLWSSIPDDELLDVAIEGPAARSEGARAAGEADARRPEGGRARRELRRPVAVSARARQRADRGAGTSTTTCASRSAAKPRCSSRHRARGSQPHRPARRRLHVRGRAAGAPLRHPERPRQLLPPRAARRRQPAPRPARTGQHADGHLDRHAHLAGVARQVGAGEPARHAGAGAAAGRRDEPRAGAEGGEDRRSLRQRLEAHRANPVCASCHKHHGPDGLRARELRSRRRAGASATAGRRSTPPGSSPTARR